MYWVLWLTLVCPVFHAGQMAGSPVATCGNQASNCSRQGSDQVPSVAVKGTAQALAQGQQPSGATSSFQTKRNRHSDSW